MKKTRFWIIVLSCGILILYLAYLLLSHKESDQKMGLLLATATLIVTCISLLYQRSSLIMQIRLNVFSDSMHLLMADEKFSESQEYIFSRAFDEDIIVVQQALQMSSQDDVGLDDIRRVLHRTRKDGEVISVDSNERKRLRKSYNKIRYFFSRMEYLGVLAEERGVETLILEYYGYTIISTYERLLPIIRKDNDERKNNELYSHYKKMYTLAQKKKRK